MQGLIHLELKSIYYGIKKRWHSSESNRPDLLIRDLGPEYEIDINSSEPIRYSDVISQKSLELGLERTKLTAAPGLDGVRKADFKQSNLEKLRDELKSQSYKPRPTKRVPIPKPDGGTRYLGISSQRDKVVQASLLIHLEASMDKRFSPFSFGFRPNKGCHHALKHIKSHWQNITWIINVDIKKCFDTINHDVLIHVLRPYVDQPTLELIIKLMNCGYVDIFSHNSINDTPGTPHGSLISPILCNIYMHILDMFVHERLIPAWNRGDERKYAKGYQLRKQLSADDLQVIAKYPELKGQIERIKHNRYVLDGNPARDPHDDSFRRLHYVRYADDFIIGFCGTRNEADEIKADLESFLLEVLKFQINTDKSSISHAESKGIKFLGVFLKYLPNKIVVDPNLEIPKGEIAQLKSTAINKVQFRAPIEYILSKAVSKGFAKLKDSGVVRATSNRRLACLEDKGIVQRFSSIIRGILNYYSFVNQRSDLWPVVSLYRKSCALTLADKHKLGTAAAVFKRYGPKLKVSGLTPKETVELYYPETLATTQKFSLGKNSADVDRTSYLNWEHELGLIAGSYKQLPKTSLVCQYAGCDSTIDLEEHHVNPQANISKNLTAFEKSLIAKQRKTITLCRKHHMILHGKNVVSE